ncbi:ATP-binding protein [Thalassotalea sp. 1_MG-2023]|uniref:ATP-binding protein n=1 Tax=Thalassotalea sp. 1_MG-2023 TaxID=3062680 RepID=UPI0026E28628|nr:ATP-binding protein [Thalassotalea sp. 1_MG-2023]MDO6425606.1 ATP-binding protein [Thalassotalea sp. 1_MG-2023]
MLKLKQFFSSIGVKLFLVFWITTILSIAMTHFLTNQLDQENVILPSNAKDMVKLSRITSRIEQQNFKTPIQAIERSDRFLKQTLFIKDPQTNHIYYHNKRFAKPLAKYLRKNEITHKTSVLFHYARISGPTTLEIQGAEYQLFIASRVKSSDVSETILLMPHWVRIFVPILLSLCFCWIFAKYLTKPVRAMEKAALVIGNGDFKARVENNENRQDELGQLAKSFNLMADKLENNISAHQRLLADVSHELRSPLTRLQITLGLLDKTLPDDEKKNNLLSRCEKEVMQLDDMISNVLTLSRHENTLEPIQMTLCDLSQLMSTIVEDAQLIANEKNINIKLNSEENIALKLNAPLLSSAVNNVISNAIKYSHEHQVIEVTLRQYQDIVEICVTDHGKGVQDHHLSKLFDPFYRVSDARDRDSGGTGLGLAIAKQAIDKHQGSIMATHNPSGGLIVTITLPYSL